MIGVLGMKMWTRPEQSVDKHKPYTSGRTTPLQDVSVTGVTCGHNNQAGITKRPQFPQSPTLITVIRSIYVHPHIAITTSRHREYGALI